MLHVIRAFLLLSAVRGLDLITTWAVTPDLSAEGNKIIRWLGWRWTLLVNVAACVIFAIVGGWLFWVLFWVSIAAACWNYSILWRMLKK